MRSTRPFTYININSCAVWTVAVVFTAFSLSSPLALYAQDDADAATQMVTGIGQAAPIALIPGGIEGRISLDLRNIEVVDALKFLSMKAGLNIIATKNVSGRITLMVDNVPVQDIFDIMLRSNGLAYLKEGDIYNVMTEDEYKMISGRRFADIREVKIFRLKYAIPDQAFSVMDALKSDVGRVLVEPDSGTTLVMDTPAALKKMEEALKTLEERNLVKVFNLKYAKAKEVEEQLKVHLDNKKVGMVKADERSNQVIVQTLPERMLAIEKIVEALDAKTKEVLIDTKIIKVRLSDTFTTGIDWEGLASLGKEFGFMYFGSYPFSVLQDADLAWKSRKVFYDENAGSTGVGAYPFSGNSAAVTGSTKTAPGEKMHIGLIDKKRDIDALVNYLQTIGNTQVLSNPKLAVINNQEARIHVGQRQAYVTTTTTSGTSTTTVSEEVTFVDTGIQLSVTPTINDDGYVTMKIKPEVSSVVDTLTTPSGNKIPIIDSSLAETTVMVKDKSTIIIGGLRKDEKTKSSDQVPYLGKIPFLGFFFRSSSDAVIRTELLVLITPYIVTGDKLTTGDERDIQRQSGKEYKDYPAFTKETQYQPPQEEPEGMIKPYKDYSTVKEYKEEKPSIKGARDDQ